jgi:dienelactone hydrolase
MKRTWRYLLFSLLAIIFLAIAGFVLWAGIPLQPDGQAIESLVSGSDVVVQQEKNRVVFAPTALTPQTGLILYPGARVDYRAYAPFAREIAESGFMVVIAKMPLNFAIFGVNRASEIMASFPEITTWAIGGHSLGGAMAAQFAGEHLSMVEGLVLWAAYPAGNNDLSDSGLGVVSIYASNDGLATLADISASEQNLPQDAVFIEIAGGNHAGFGWYGAQNGDGNASISKTEQQSQIVDATIDLLESIE